MSEVHVYGVVPAAAKPALEERGARLVVHRDVAALVSDVDGGGARAASVLRAYWRVLESAAEVTTVLPVRFGTAMADDGAVVDEFLAPGHDDLAARLEDLAGKVQLTVKGFYDQDALMAGVVARSPAVARLRDQVRALPEAAAYYKRIELGQLVAAEVERGRERDAHDIFERLRPLALAAKLEAPSTADAAVHAAFLVEKDRIDEFSGAVATLAREVEDRMSLRYLGPLPPYSFTGDGGLAGVGAWA
jgi:hypothetical protein